MKKNNDRLGQKLAIKYFRVFVISDNEVPNTAIKDERYLVTWLNLAKIQERLYESTRPTLVITKNKSQISLWRKKKSLTFVYDFKLNKKRRANYYNHVNLCLEASNMLILNMLPFSKDLTQIEENNFNIIPISIQIIKN